MAIIKAVNSKNSISGIIRYVVDEEKTEEKLIAGLNCNPETVEEEMKYTKERFNKVTGRQYKHFIQSFHPRENIDGKRSNFIGVKWAESVFNGFEVLIVTHMDKGHLHNHFIINSVSFLDGSKFRYSKWDLENYKNKSDEICLKEGLSIINEKRKGDYIDKATCQLGMKGESWKMKLLSDIKALSNKNLDWNSKREILKAKGYEIKRVGGQVMYKAPNEKWFIGSKRLVSQFGEEGRL